MSFYGNPLKHGKGVNKPFRSPLIKTDPNQDRGDGSPNSRRLNTPSKVNQISRVKSLGFKSPMRAHGFISPLKPLEIMSPSKELEVKAVSKSLIGLGSPLKRLEHKSLGTKISLRPIENTPPKTSRIVSSKSSEKGVKKSLSLENELSSKEKDRDTHEKVENSSPKFFSNEKSLKSKLRSPAKDLDSEIKEEKSPIKNIDLNTPPPSPMILEVIKSPEYQPVVKLRKLSSDLQKISKQDLAILINRINEKQRKMAELRAIIPHNRKIPEVNEERSGEKKT
ncbi:uncharacterized protein LOC117171946 isoform X2 [Belonocnema kinseyi]|uniref:uncharacterized protein LOC117171946 isoform X2 n=1 Tax=Belonocnema kinseyi TaxID=2817044 RepID=UPI00143DE72D|nr:uncharacterized protein LOC117171946 isoform X2 [Belonocnema kinseyi]